MELITKYRDFILDLVEIPDKVKLITRTEQEPGKYVIGHLKMGLSAYIPVEITIKEINSRSATYKIKFDKYDLEFIFYISRQVSPVDLLEKFNSKIYDIVNNKLIEEERWELIESFYKKQRASFSKMFKGMKFNEK